MRVEVNVMLIVFELIKIVVVDDGFLGVLTGESHYETEPNEELYFTTTITRKPESSHKVFKFQYLNASCLCYKMAGKLTFS